MSELKSIIIKFLSVILVVPCSFGYKTFTNETFLIEPHHSTKGKGGFFTYHYDEEALKARVPEYPIHPMILGRRSVTECTGEPLTDDELFPLFEALRWGPSNFNTQPWRVVYAHRGTTRFNEFLDVMAPVNKQWNINSSVILVLIANMFTAFDEKEKFMINEPMSIGLGYAGLTLEGTARGLMVHAMSGFDRSKVAKLLKIDNDPHHMVALMVGVGKPKPNVKYDISQRKPLAEFISKEGFKASWIYY